VQTLRDAGTIVGGLVYELLPLAKVEVDVVRVEDALVPLTADFHLVVTLAAIDPFLACRLCPLAAVA